MCTNERRNPFKSLIVLLDRPQTREVVEPDESDVHSHLDPGEHGGHLAPVNLLPPHRDLVHANVQLLGDEEDFHVERPSLNVQVVENHLFLVVFA